MDRHDLQSTELRCPDQTCGGAMMRNECAVSSQVCDFEAVESAEPVDTAVLMNVIVRRERVRRKEIVAAVVAVLVAIVGASFWLLRPAQASPNEPRQSRPLSFQEVRDALEREVAPDGLSLPAFYGNPYLFLGDRERVAQSELALFWAQLDRENKRSLLEIVKESESEFLFAFVLEISWFTSSTEPDIGIARSMLGALHIGSEANVDLALFAANHILNTTPHAIVRTHAAEFVTALDERRRRIGR